MGRAARGSWDASHRVSTTGGDLLTEVMIDAEGRYRTLALPNGSYRVVVEGENGSVAAEAPLTAELSR